MNEIELKEIDEIGFLEWYIPLMQARLERLKNKNNPPKQTPNPRRLAIILDAGHGGIDPNTGEYTTFPAKMHQHNTGHFHNGGVFYEGVFNRNLTFKIKTKLEKLGFETFELAHEYLDTPLSERSQKANAFNQKKKNEGVRCLGISVHGDAHTTEKANGWSVIVYNKASQNSRKFATILGNRIGELRLFKYRRSNQIENYWERNFHILRETNMPFILAENGFFTNFSDASKMINADIQDKIATAYAEAVLEYEKLI